MKTIWLLCLVLLCGCNTARYTVTTPSGVRKELTVVRVMWTTQGYAAQIDGDWLVAVKSKTDAKAVKLAAEGAAEGAVKGMTGK